MSDRLSNDEIDELLYGKEKFLNDSNAQRLVSKLVETIPSNKKELRRYFRDFLEFKWFRKSGKWITIFAKILNKKVEDIQYDENLLKDVSSLYQMAFSEGALNQKIKFCRMLETSETYNFD